jgi:hypothetical protein
VLDYPEVIDNMTAARQDRGMANPRATTFLVLAILGLIGQVVIFGAFLADEGLDLGALGDQLFASTIAALTFADLIACAVVYLVWMPRAAARAGISWWPYAVATLGGLCFAFPLFLYARERRRDRAPQPSALPA